MSTELAVAPEVEESSIVRLTANRVTPDTIQGVHWLAQMTVDAGMAPKGIDTVGKLAVALTAGFELGLTYTQSLRGIMVVNNRPTVWGDVALSLVRKSPQCVGIEERIEGTGDETVAVCIGTRSHNGTTEVQQRTFSAKDARMAGLLGKQGPWSTYPKRMLQMRARSFLLRDLFPDLLNGMEITEEAQDVEYTPAGPMTISTPGETPAAAPSPLDEIDDVEPLEGEAAPKSQPVTPAAAQAALGAETMTEAEKFVALLEDALQDRGIPTGKGCKAFAEIRGKFGVPALASLNDQQQIAVLSDVNCGKYDHLKKGEK